MSYHVNMAPCVICDEGITVLQKYLRSCPSSGLYVLAAQLRRPIGTFYLLSAKLVIHNSDLNKSTTICKVGDLEVFPKAFLDLETYTRP